MLEKLQQLSKLSSMTGLVRQCFFGTSTAAEKYYVQKNYLKRWARRDMKRRELFKDYEAERTSLRVIHKSDVLPAAIKMQAAEDLAKLPRDSSITRIRHRCTLTDRSRGNVIKYRISRIKFRDFADKGWISGYTRSSW